MTAKSDGGNRTRPSSAIYRALMEAIEARRVELGYAMATVNDLAGLQDGFFSKMIYPDTPCGRQARWETVDLAVEALFGKEFDVQIVAKNWREPSMLGTLQSGPSTNALQVRHWRHRSHFKKLGHLGGRARFEGKTEDEISAMQRADALKRWKKYRKAKRAQRQGAAHRGANASKASAVV